MNNKIISLTLSLMLLTGCSSIGNPEFKSTLVNGTDNVITVNGVDITKNDIYHYMLNSLGSYSVVDAALNYITDIEITDQNLIDERVLSTISNYSEYIDNGNIENYALSQGFDDQDDYINSKILPQVKKDLLKEKYIETFFDDILVEYKPVYLKVISFYTDVEAQEALDSIETLEDFDSYIDTNEGFDYGMVTTKGGVEENILNMLDLFVEDGVYNEIISTDQSSETMFSLVYIYNSDKNTNKELIISDLATMSELSSTYESYYLDYYKFSIYEEYLKKIVEK